MNGTPDNPRSALRQLIAYVLRYRLPFAFAVAASALVSITSAASLAMLKPMTEAVFGIEHNVDNWLGQALAPIYNLIAHFAEGNPLGALIIICLVFFGITVVRSVLRFSQVYTTHWIGNRVILDLQHELYDKMTGYHSAYFARHPIGGLLSYYTADIRLIGINIFNAFSQLLLDPLTVIVLLAFLLMLQWQLTLAYALMAPALVLTVRFFARKNRRASRDAQDALESIGAFLQDHFRLIRVVQAYGMQGAQRRRLEVGTHANFSAMMRKVKAFGLSSPLNELIGVAAVCVILMLGGYVIFVQQSMDRTSFIVFLGVLISLYQPIRRIERSIQEMQHGLAAAERVFEALHENATLPEDNAASRVERFEKSITFENVGFAYDGERKVLDAVSFAAKRGETTAFVGPSGAGKTTLVNLVPRFYDPTEGRILFDGADLRSFDLLSLRSMIAYVPQEQAVFSSTVWDNITCGVEGATPEAVESAAKAAFAHEFINELPNGYQTVIGGEDGAAFSGGQCQRIAIARAFFRDAPILILDEATSALDSESEQRVKRSLDQLMQGRTVFVIAHRLSTILQADRIVVMDAGRIVDSGTHGELLKSCALYQRLYELQFQNSEVKTTSELNPAE
ncbi:MAG: ABC transporter ATP-binding protein [Candidatus Hinthialibacter antarcticus]|nr:ABC transporter ATP-binding protein [Candidatus Hinthialibacter antarcticus]